MRAYVDQVLAILPFEPKLYVELGGPPCHYVGHPLIERVAELRPSTEEAQRRRADPPVVLVLPGSRGSEIRYLLAIFADAIEQVAARAGDMELVLPTMPHLLPQLREAVADWSMKPRLVVDPAEKWAAFRRARAALAASGTVTLELALSGVPAVTAYRLSALEAFIAWLIGLGRLQSVILANLVLGENVVPEFLQSDCTPEKLAGALLPLLLDTVERQRQVAAIGRLDAIMTVGGVAPSARAAASVLEVAQCGR
jgi:lipid-A-disaccharide synthase